MAKRNTIPAPIQAPAAPVLPAEVAAHYAIPDGQVTVFFNAEFEMVDLSKINLTLAARLAERGYLKKLDQTDPA